MLCENVVNYILANISDLTLNLNIECFRFSILILLMRKASMFVVCLSKSIDVFDDVRVVWILVVLRISHNLRIEALCSSELIIIVKLLIYVLTSYP